MAFIKTNQLKVISNLNSMLFKIDGDHNVDEIL